MLKKDYLSRISHYLHDSNLRVSIRNIAGKSSAQNRVWSLRKKFIIIGYFLNSLLTHILATFLSGSGNDSISNFWCPAVGHAALKACARSMSVEPLRYTRAMKSPRNWSACKLEYTVGKYSAN